MWANRTIFSQKVYNEGTRVRYIKLIVVKYTMAKRKVLVVYYSRHNHTKMACEAIAQKLGADVEEIHDTKKRDHLFGWFQGAFDEELRTPTTISPPTKHPKDYDLVILGTPIWDGVVPAVKAYATQYKKALKRVAFVITFGASAENASYVLSEILGTRSLATLELQDREIVRKEADAKIEAFIQKLKK